MKRLLIGLLCLVYTINDKVFTAQADEHLWMPMRATAPAPEAQNLVYNNQQAFAQMANHNHIYIVVGPTAPNAPIQPTEPEQPTIQHATNAEMSSLEFLLNPLGQPQALEQPEQNQTNKIKELTISIAGKSCKATIYCFDSCVNLTKFLIKNPKLVIKSATPIVLLLGLNKYMREDKSIIGHLLNKGQIGRAHV
mgnify:CR=1 FL=1